MVKCSPICEELVASGRAKKKASAVVEGGKGGEPLN